MLSVESSGFDYMFCIQYKNIYFCDPFPLRRESFLGDVAQLVEQRTENPCVGGSIPSVTTKKSKCWPKSQHFLFVNAYK
jgi:hypothetical protein